MNIAYDGHIFRWQRTGGISRYFHEIITRLPRDISALVIGTDADSHLPAREGLKVSRRSAMRPRKWSQPVKSWWWRQKVLRDCDVIHPTYYDLSGGLSYSDLTEGVVVTVHDFIAARYPHLEPNSAHTISIQAAAVRRADHVICVSQATQRDLLEFFPDKAGRSSVIYHGSSFPVAERAADGEIFERPTFLCVGRRATYKNFFFLLRAFAKACSVNPLIRLYTAGPALSEEELWQLHFLGIHDRVVAHQNPSEAELRHLYRSSVALLYPSRHEGFGIPPLEAMACGTLAVTANTTSLPEVVADAGIMLDPAREDQWAECILAIAGQKVPRTELVERGLRRARELTWADSARRHVEIYRKLQR